MPKLTDKDIQEFLEGSLTVEEHCAIKLALESESPWKHEGFDEPTKSALMSVKIKIKEFHLGKTNHKCCYCRRSLRDAIIESDREHVVPKSRCKSLAYDIFNLSIACKRCNMTYKGEKVDHLIRPEDIESEYKDPDSYRIPHPNIEDYEDHIVRNTIQCDRGEVTTYKCYTDQGKFLYEFVQLEKLCVDEFDIAQGGKNAIEEIMKAFTSTP